MPAAVHKELEQVARDAYEARSGPAEAAQFIEKIDETVFDACGIPDPGRDGIGEFCASIVERT